MNVTCCPGTFPGEGWGFHSGRFSGGVSLITLSFYFLFSFWNYQRQMLGLYFSSECHHSPPSFSFYFPFCKPYLTLFSKPSIDFRGNFNNSIFNFQALFLFSDGSLFIAPCSCFKSSPVPTRMLIRFPLVCLPHCLYFL